jgi:PAS domain S-box-containing protein
VKVLPAPGAGWYTQVDRRVNTKLLQEMREHFRLMGAAYVVFVCGFISTALSYYWVAQYVLTRDTTRFTMTVREMQSAVVQRSQAYTDALRGVGGLVSAVGAVDRRGWERYLASLHLPRNYPGIDVVGYVEKVKPEGIRDHEARVRAQGWPDYIWPIDRNEEVFYPVALALGPTNQSVSLVGRDFSRDSRHRRAMESARDTGLLTTTGDLGPARLAGNTNLPSEFVVYLAVYAGGRAPETEVGRRESLEGYVFAHCRLEPIMESLFSEKLREMVMMEMFDGVGVDSTSLMFSTLELGRPARGRAAIFEDLTVLDAFNRKYSLRFSSLPGFTPVLDRYLPPATFLGGMAVTILLFGIAWTLVRARIESEEMSRSLGLSEESLRSANDQLRVRMEETATAKRDLERSLSLQIATLESTADGIVVVDLDGRIVSHNQRFTDLWHVPPHVLAGKSDSDFQRFAAEWVKTPETFLRRVQDLYSKREAEGFEIVELRDGRVFERYSRPQRIAGECVGRVWSFRDVSERHKSEEERKRVHRFLESLIQNTPAVAIQVYDRVGRVELWNPASERMYGFTALEMKGQRLQDKVLSQGESEMFDRQLEWIWTGQQPLPPFEWAIRHRDGQVRHLYSVMFPILHAGETAGVCSADVDITERKHAEADLRASHDYVKSLIDSSIDMIISTDSEGRIREFNASAEKVFGWAKVDMLGQPLQLLFVSQEEGQRVLLRTVGEGHFSGEISMKLRSGGVISAYVTSSVLRDTRQRTEGVVAVIRDITERKKLEAELFRASKLDSIGRLAGGIAHDFNNILMVIIGNLSLLRVEIDSQHPLGMKLDQMEKAANRGRHLTQQLLTFSKGGAPVKRVMALTELLEDSADLSLRGSSVRCDIRVPAELRTVEIDPGQMNQVFHNLFTNAMEAMPDGGTILVRAENLAPGTSPGVPLPDREYVKLSIRDHGEGVPSESISKVFDPYFTTKKGRSGLGLPVVYSVVKQHQGHVEFTSTPGAGTTVDIFLPAATGASEPWVEESYVQMANNRVLVMDDEPVIREVLNSMLSLLGYQVVLASDGEEALSLYASAKQAGNPVAAIIMDLSVVGGMGGKEAIQKIREHDLDIPVVVSSGYSNDPVMANFRQYGFNGVICKPYQFETLARALVELVPHDLPRPPV